jgi:hypothetical protein
MKTSASKLAVLLVIVLALLTACSKDPLNVTVLSEKPAEFNGKSIRVSGCFRTDGENALLLPCRSLDSDIREAMWVENLDTFEHFESIAPNNQKRRSTHEGQLSDADREQMRRLFSTKTEKPFPVTLEGEFQTGAKYGHLGGFDKTAHPVQRFSLGLI